MDTVWNDAFVNELVEVKTQLKESTSRISNRELMPVVAKLCTLLDFIIEERGVNRLINSFSVDPKEDIPSYPLIAFSRKAYAHPDNDSIHQHLCTKAIDLGAGKRIEYEGDAEPHTLDPVLDRVYYIEAGVPGTHYGYAHLVYPTKTHDFAVCHGPVTASEPVVGTKKELPPKPTRSAIVEEFNKAKQVLIEASARMARLERVIADMEAPHA
jgi:hypothetical protein